MANDSVPGKKIILAILSAALFMETLDITILSTAIPSMSLSFSVDPIELKLALTSYLFSLALFIPISGWIAERWGEKKVFILALSIFTLSSMGCGKAATLADLVFARVLQGVGGAFMMPVGRLILLHTFPKSELVQATNFMTTPALLGPLLGPVIGGWITTNSSWPWVFYVNVPIGILGVGAALYYLKGEKGYLRRPFDWRGFLLFGLSLSGLFFVVETIHTDTVPTGLMWLVFTLVLCGFLLFYWHYRRSAHPVLNLKLFVLRTFAIAALGNVWSRLGISSLSFLLPLFFQMGFGLSPFHSGLLICASAAGMITMKLFNRAFLHRWGFRKTLSMTALLSGFSLVSFASIESIHIAWILLLVFINGLVSSLQFLGMNLLYYAEIVESEMGDATSIASTLQHVASGFGITFNALILQLFVGWSDPLGFGDPTPFRHAFLVMGGIVCLSTLIFLKLKPTDGHEIS